MFDQATCFLVHLGNKTTTVQKAELFDKNTCFNRYWRIILTVHLLFFDPTFNPIFCSQT